MDKKRQEEFNGLLKNPLKFRYFLLKNLPAAYFSGLRLIHASKDSCEVSIPYKWFTRNPFRSTYFACLSMAAEMTTGILAMGNIYACTSKISMLVVSVEGKFYKKATGITRFSCIQGKEIAATVLKASEQEEGITSRALSSGFNEKGELVAEFWITWSFKKKVKSVQHKAVQH